ncbi:unnamed protein product [Caenorhabditis angaria]|uniref:Uncharacterized protein n=1 Tax=Caenorhabditis angaria TaxID=860376 RepID=A0A9P1NA76_9PELO|nr:unnamed protein product [Caenorhabditis angaria]
MSGTIPPVPITLVGTRTPLLITSNDAKRMKFTTVLFCSTPFSLICDMIVISNRIASRYAEKNSNSKDDRKKLRTEHQKAVICQKNINLKH